MHQLNRIAAIIAFAMILTTAPALAAPAPNAADTLVGQMLSFCKNNVTFDMEVREALLTKSAYGFSTPGYWVLMTANVLNTGNSSEHIYLAFTLTDERGRVYDMPIDSPEFDYARKQKAFSSTENLQPGITKRVTAAFEVSADVKTLTPTSDNWSCR